MAALLAKEESIVSGLQFIERGYESLVEKLLILGVDVKKESVSAPTADEEEDICELANL